MISFTFTSYVVILKNSFSLLVSYLPRLLFSFKWLEIKCYFMLGEFEDSYLHSNCLFIFVALIFTLSSLLVNVLSVIIRQLHDSYFPAF